MSEQKPFNQNVIAIIWDFDKTLSPVFMQQPLFEHFGVDEERFWKEVNALPAYYAKINVTVQPDSCYLGHLLTCVREGIMPGLNNRLLRALIRFSHSPAASQTTSGVVLHITHLQLAQAIGVARETVSLALKDLRDQNVLKTGRNQVTFDPRAIEQLLQNRLQRPAPAAPTVVPAPAPAPTQSEQTA